MKAEIWDIVLNQWFLWLSCHPWLASLFDRINQTISLFFKPHACFVRMFGGKGGFWELICKKNRKKRMRDESWSGYRMRDAGCRIRIWNFNAKGIRRKVAKGRKDEGWGMNTEYRRQNGGIMKGAKGEIATDAHGLNRKIQTKNQPRITLIARINRF